MKTFKTLSMISALALVAGFAGAAQAQSLTSRNEGKVGVLSTMQDPSIKTSPFGSAQIAGVGASTGQSVNLNGVIPAALSFPIKGDLKAVNSGKIDVVGTMNGAEIKSSPFASTTVQAAGASGNANVAVNGIVLGLDVKLNNLDIRSVNSGAVGVTALHNNPGMVNSPFASFGTTGVGASTGIGVNVNFTPTP